MKSLEEVRRIKQEAEQRLMSLPHVTGVGVGYQTVEGRKTDISAIIVYVTDKAQIGDTIPETIEGVPVEVVGASFTPNKDQ